MGLVSLPLKPLGGDYVSESPRHGFKCPRSGGGMRYD